MIKVENCTETTYEDGSYWISYRVDDKYGYELYEPQSTEEQNLEYLTKVANSPGNIEQYTNKPSIDICSPILKEYILECLGSDNEMWYVDDHLLKELGDKGDIPAILDKLKEEVNNLGLSNYVIFDYGNIPIVIFGGVITKFLF